MSDAKPATAAAALWTDDLLYTPAGQSHDAWRLLPALQLAPLTAEAQELLVAHQFPAGGCVGARFAVSNANGISGLGSDVHVATLHLAIALEQGRIFLWSEGVGQEYTDGETCPTSINLECFLRAPSSCNLGHARAPGADTIDLEYAMAGEPHGVAMFHVPAVMKSLWEGWKAGPLPRAMELKYWWRAQGAAFLTRFNDATIKAIRAMRTNFSAIVVTSGAGAPPLHPKSSMIGPGWPLPSQESNTDRDALLSTSFPFVRGVTSMHVRHGDKGKEMTLAADGSFFSAAESLVQQNPLGLVRAAFISTEDPATLAAAANERQGWAMAWYSVPRINSNGIDQLEKLPIPRAVLTRIWLLQLLMALECDAWVGTRGSNWNR